jgi:uncharacterized membrane protein (DUF4010 family)
MLDSCLFYFKEEIVKMLKRLIESDVIDMIWMIVLIGLVIVILYVLYDQGYYMATHKDIVRLEQKIDNVSIYK